VSQKSSFDSAYQSHYQNVFDREDAVQFFSGLLQSHLPEDKQTSILDIGCGTGLGLSALDSLGYKEIQGIDINSLQVAATKKRGFIAHHITSASDWLRTSEERFDFIIATDVLEHMDSTECEEVIRQCKAKLISGGQLLCTVPNANSTIASRWRYIDLTHKTSFTESSLRTLFYAGGFQNVDVRGCDPFLIFDAPRAGLKRGLSWGLRKAVRVLRRIEMIGELGPDEGLSIPLNINLIALAEK